MEVGVYTQRIRLAIFASGGGSNAKKIIEYFEHHALVEISLVISNKADSGVFKIANEHNIETFILNKSTFYETSLVTDFLKEAKIDYIILAGFLWLVPKGVVEAFPNKILNIHPSLLPKYGGKGMYGHHVHEAVKNNCELESGMTIHVVNEKFDDGNIIFQKKCLINDQMDASEIAAEVLKLEHSYYPQVIEEFIKNSYDK